MSDTPSPPVLCWRCQQPIHPERVELNLTTCLPCAESFPAQRPRALVVSVSPEGDTEIDLVSTPSLRLTELNYLPQSHDPEAY